MLILDRFSMGIGDRFAHQGRAQLKAVQMAKEKGVHITPVWNKSYREHQIIGSEPLTTRTEADQAVKELGWTGSYFIDADHINLDNVDFFMNSCDFFTIDVADYIGKPADRGAISDFVSKYKDYVGVQTIPESEIRLEISSSQIRRIAELFLHAVQKAAEIYRHIENQKGRGNFITEVSMDETDVPQSPVDLFFILAALADQDVPLQTIAPKFSGRFNKGVDYAGDIERFQSEFEQDVLVISWAVQDFALPKNLKLSVHSGSDKFSIYPSIKRVIDKYDKGLHLKTAGTTWLEELIGLAEAGGEALELVREIYRKAGAQFEALSAPYKSVIDIDKAMLPSPEEVESWDGKRFAETLRHDPQNSHYNAHFRQLLHIGYKIAAQMRERYLDALRTHEEIIAHNVRDNLFSRHIKQLYPGVS